MPQPRGRVWRCGGHRFCAADMRTLQEYDHE